ncbi:hypothetical protein T492DRAFT_1123377 [Pavlovales sp. CCMP2436]|nr:hypothetical protein T492DRAFT_1123377 [Pavlovales sp. CCMP2436]
MSAAPVTLEKGAVVQGGLLSVGGKDTASDTIAATSETGYASVDVLGPQKVNNSLIVRLRRRAGAAEGGASGATTDGTEPLVQILAAASGGGEGADTLIVDFLRRQATFEVRVAMGSGGVSLNLDGSDLPREVPQLSYMQTFCMQKTMHDRDALDVYGLSDDEAEPTHTCCSLDGVATCRAKALRLTPCGDSAAVPVEGLTLEARLLRGAAKGQLNNATTRRFGHRGDPVKLEKACAAMAEAHARFARDPTAHAFRKLLGRTARIALTGHFFNRRSTQGAARHLHGVVRFFGPARAHALGR